MKANPCVGSPLQDERHPGVAQGQTCQSGISVIGDFELGRPGEMGDVFTTHDHGNLNQARFEQSINDFNGSEHAGTSIPDIKSQSTIASEVFSEAYRRIWLNGIVKVWAIVPGHVAADQQINIRRVIF